MAKVVVGISGGVDSSVAAYLLQQQGHEVIGLFMQNWHETTGVLSGECPWEEDIIIAKLVAKRLGIPFHHVDLSEVYREKVVKYLFEEYEKGRTPNPDVLCNREIKFDVFIDAAKKYGAEYIATGHYCRKETIENSDGTFHRLLAGVDNNKDQSYFLCQLSQQQLEKALFPIGHLEKPEVREIADKLDLPTATRKDSQGICFIGKVDLPVFLQQKLVAKKGDIIEIPEDYKGSGSYDKNNLTDGDLEEMSKPYSFKKEMGDIIGEHNGAHFFTIGQRKGLNVGGKAQPLFVISTNVDNNIVYTGQGHDHKGLNRPALFVQKDEIHLIRPDFKLEPGEDREFDVRIRYRQPLQKARLYMREKGLYIVFNEPQRGIASGQFASWYDGEELIGSGVIAE